MAISRLIEKNVLIRISGRLLALGIAAPVVPFQWVARRLPKALRDTAWAQLKAEEDLDKVRPSLAASCVRLPALSLSEWLGTSSMSA